MTHAKLALPLAALGVLAAAPLPAQPPRGGSDLGANAAIKYWQAFAHLPPRSDEQQRRLGDWAATPLDATARRLVADGQNSFLYLRRGAALPRCDWSLNYEDGIGLLLPHLDKARTLALLTCLRARLALADGHPADAVDDVLAVFALGRHVADPIMICLLVDYSVEQQVIDATALLLPKLDAAARRKLAERLDALPPAGTLEDTLATERDYFGGWAIRWLKEQERSGAGDLRAKVRAMLLGSEGVDDIMKLVDDNSAARLIQALESLRPFYEEQRRLVALPRDQFLAQWPDLEKRQSANAVVRLMLPSVIKVVNARDRCRARFAMLKAAVAVAGDGQAALAKHPDPFGQGPFESKSAPGGGFELRSKLTLDGQPVTLTVKGP
jgi:hypothetical protein